MGVPVILVVEDDIRYYSSFLPVIYTELITQSRRSSAKDSTWRTNWCACAPGPRFCSAPTTNAPSWTGGEYREYLLGVISDVEFPAMANSIRKPDSSWRA